jgi:hypothetical protein
MGRLPNRAQADNLGSRLISIKTEQDQPLENYVHGRARVRLRELLTGACAAAGEEETQ